MQKLLIGLCVLLFGLSALTCVAEPARRFLPNPEVERFIQEQHEQHGYNKTALRSWFNQATVQESALRAMGKQAEAKPWYDYQPIFLNPTRIEGGVAFWKKHKETLARAEATYGVPAEIIVAILGVETRYGTTCGTYPVFDSLATLAFFYPKRAAFFKKELENYLHLVHTYHWDPLAVKGSFTGAMGTPQFMPSSYRKFAVDFSGKATYDLINDPTDAIGSVANYFAEHGWKRDQEIVIAANAKRTLQLPSDRKLTHQYTLSQVKSFGLIPQGKASVQKFSIIELQAQNSKEYWLGTNNFYVITRYNHSQNYAMAVTQLAQEIRKEVALQKIKG